MEKIIIREMSTKDLDNVMEIYSQALEEGKSTFTKDIPTYEVWDKNHLQDCRYILEKDNKVIGWCSLAPTSSREVYRGVVEVSIYLHRDYRGRGYGKNYFNIYVTRVKS